MTGRHNGHGLQSTSYGPFGVTKRGGKKPLMASEPASVLETTEPSFKWQWTRFMASMSTRFATREEWLSWRPFHSRAILLYHASKGTCQILPPAPEAPDDDLDAQQAEHDEWCRELQDADEQVFGPLAKRGVEMWFVHADLPEREDFKYYEFALTRIWDDCIKAQAEAGQTDAELAHLKWLKYRAIVQLCALPDQPRWILPEDEADDPAPGAISSLFDGLDIRGKREDRDLIEKIRAKLTKFLPALEWYDGLEGRWIMQKELGTGAFGNATLWVQRDWRGRFVNRVVTKDVYLTIDQWDNKEHERMWKINSNTADTRLSLIPSEASMLTRLHPMASQGAPIMAMRSCIIHGDMRMYRLLLEFCPFGDLTNVLEKHLALRGLLSAGYTEVDCHLPESALWAIFERLIDAACVLHTGQTVGGIPPAEEWKREIVHLDLKPGNVFLDYPDSDAWSNYPVFKMGDLGHAAETFPGDPRNPGPNLPWGMSIAYPGTPGYSAPEQYDSLKMYRVSEKTNIWQIANIVIDAMNLSPYAPQQVMFEGTADDRPRIHDEGRRYTKALKDLLGRCTEPVPAKRPDLVELRNTIRKYTETYSDFRSRKDHDDDYLHYDSSDQYKLYMRHD